MTDEEILSQASRIRANRRWAKTTPEERSKYASKIAKAGHAKRKANLSTI